MVAGVTELLPTSASNSFKTNAITGKFLWLRGGDLNPRPLGYEPNELPDCSTPRHFDYTRAG